MLLNSENCPWFDCVTIWSLYLSGNVYQPLEIILHIRQSCLFTLFNPGSVVVSGMIKRSDQWLNGTYIFHTMFYKIYIMQFKTIWFSSCWSLLPCSFIHRKSNYIKESMTGFLVINNSYLRTNHGKLGGMGMRISFSDIY